MLELKSTPQLEWDCRRQLAGRLVVWTHEIGAGLRDIGIGIVRPGIGHKYIAIRRSNTLAVAGVLLLAAVRLRGILLQTDLQHLQGLLPY